MSSFFFFYKYISDISLTIFEHYSPTYYTLATKWSLIHSKYTMKVAYWNKHAFFSATLIYKNDCILYIQQHKFHI